MIEIGMLWLLAKILLWCFVGGFALVGLLVIALFIFLAALPEPTSDGEDWTEVPPGPDPDDVEKGA